MGGPKDDQHPTIAQSLLPRPKPRAATGGTGRWSDCSLGSTTSAAWWSAGSATLKIFLASSPRLHPDPSQGPFMRLILD
jgi:hypothetical protein